MTDVLVRIKCLYTNKNSGIYVTDDDVSEEDNNT